MSTAVPARYRAKKKQMRASLGLYDSTPPLVTRRNGSSSSEEAPPISPDSLTSPISPSGRKPSDKITQNHDNSCIIKSLDIILPTQTIHKENAPTNVQVSDFVSGLCSEHRYELGSDPDELMLWEVIEISSKEKIRRPLRYNEYLQNIVKLWESLPDHKNRFFLEITSAVFRLDTKSLAFLNPRRDILSAEGGPVALNRKVYWNLRDSWHKTTASVLSNGHLNLTRAIHHNDDRTININEFELYECIGVAAPASHILCLRSQQDPRYFLNKADFMYMLATDSDADYDLLRNMFYSLRYQVAERNNRLYQANIEKAKSASIPSGRNKSQDFHIVKQIRPGVSASHDDRSTSLGLSPAEFTAGSLLDRSTSARKTSPTKGLNPQLSKSNSLLDRTTHSQVKHVMPISPASSMGGGRGLVGNIPSSTTSRDQAVAVGRGRSKQMYM